MWRLPRTLYPPNRPAHLALPTPRTPPARCLLPPPQAAHADALAHYGALLQELHLGPDARWRDYAERVARDPQGRGSNPALGRGEAEDLFRQHVQGLYEAALEGYLDLLDAQRSLFATEQSLVLTRLQQLQNQVVLYKVLGGGWTEQAAQENATPRS